jgi:acyl-CoA synthetase (AMP-forming)/AMP-acid ligase II
MLFTSGSESLPKAVVLTHKNILSDIDGALQLVPFQKHETLLGFLPPFHSFGFTINTIFPLIAPVQAVYTPDPNDARTIGKILKHTHASIVSVTPTFLRMILVNNDSTSLRSLRYTFVGAEKCSNEVFSLFHQKCPDGTILEGYGITECSPIVTVNPLI